MSYRRALSTIVARVRPRTSKGITDLLLLYLIRLGAVCPSKKLARMTEDADGAERRATRKKFSLDPSTLQPDTSLASVEKFFRAQYHEGPARLYFKYSPAS